MSYRKMGYRSTWLDEIRAGELGLPINGCYATLSIMRVFLMLLIFAIGFSGYSAAAHAFDHEFCGASIVMQHGQHDHHNHDHQQDTDTKKLDNQKKFADCHHCFTAHAIGLPDYPVVNSPDLAAVSNSQLTYGFTDEVFFSLLRPPKFFV